MCVCGGVTVYAYLDTYTFKSSLFCACFALLQVFKAPTESETHTLCCQAPLAGLTAPLSMAQRGQRCQRGAGALCAATLDQRQPSSHVHSTQCAEGHRTHTAAQNFHQNICPPPDARYSFACPSSSHPLYSSV